MTRGQGLNFSPRQEQIIFLVGEGFTDKEVAAQLTSPANGQRLSATYQRNGFTNATAFVTRWLLAKRLPEVALEV